MAPVGLGAAALGRSVFDCARAKHEQTIADDVLAATASFTAIALFLLSLGSLAGTREAAVLVGLACAVFLAGQLRGERRLDLLFVCVVAALLGTEPRVGLALIPAMLGVFLRLSARAAGLRGVAQAALLLTVGALVAYAVMRPSLHGLVPSEAMFLAWVSDSSRVVGASGCAFALAGTLLAVTSASPRRHHALVVVLLFALQSATGVAGPCTVLAVALATGLGLAEVGARARVLSWPASVTVLAPLALITLMEPLAMRLESGGSKWPSLGPVPPADTMSATHGPSSSSPHPRARPDNPRR